MDEWRMLTPDVMLLHGLNTSERTGTPRDRPAGTWLTISHSSKTRSRAVFVFSRGLKTWYVPQLCICTDEELIGWMHQELAQRWRGKVLG